MQNRVSVFQPTTDDVISALAEGADRIVARQVLDRHSGSSLIVPLPLPASDYLRELKSDRSRAEFLELLSRADSVVEMAPAITRDHA